MYLNIDTIFVILSQYATTMDLKLCNQDVTEVSTFSFNLSKGIALSLQKLQTPAMFRGSKVIRHVTDKQLPAKGWPVSFLFCDHLSI